MNLYKVVLTGGPGGGKSTILEEIQNKFTNKDTRVISVPETASLLSKGKLKPTECLDTLAFQEEVFNLQKQKELSADRLASKYPEENIIIVFDRAILDNRAYLEPGQFETMLYDHNDNEMEILDNYDLVINLMTAANLEGKYLKESNPERTEDDGFAKFLDKKTLDSWLFHRNIYNVEATDNFEDKINRVIDIISENINKTKYESTKYFATSDNVEKFIIKNNLKSIYEENYYLMDLKEARVYLSKRTDGSNVSYVYKKIIIDDQKERIIEDKQISERDFIKLISIYKPKDIRGNYLFRFVYDNQVFEIVNYNKENYYFYIVNKEPNKNMSFPMEFGDIASANCINLNNHIKKFGRKRYLK